MQRRYGSPTAWGAACNAFDYLPLAAVINQKMFCVHGGLSPQVRSPSPSLASHQDQKMEKRPQALAETSQMSEYIMDTS